MKIINQMLVLFCLGMLTSCASIVSTSTYPVEIKTEPLECDIVLYKNNQMVHKGKSPTTVVLSSSSGYFQGADYTLKASHEGYQTQNIVFSSFINPWYFGNLGFGWLIGFLIVDPISGAMWRLPNTVYTHLEPIKEIRQNSR